MTFIKKYYEADSLRGGGSVAPKQTQEEKKHPFLLSLSSSIKHFKGKGQGEFAAGILLAYNRFKDGGYSQSSVGKKDLVASEKGWEDVETFDEKNYVPSSRIDEGSTVASHSSTAPTQMSKEDTYSIEVTVDNLSKEKYDWLMGEILKLKKTSIDRDSLSPSREDGWISVEEFEQKVYELLGDKPVIKMLRKQNIPFDKWGENVYGLIDKALGSVREVRVLLPSPPKEVKQ